MTRRRRVRRRLLWSGVLLGLLFLIAAVSVLRVGLWVGHKFAGPPRPTRRERMILRRTSLALAAVLGALLVAAPAGAADRGAGKIAQSAAPASDWLERLAAVHSMRDPVGGDRVAGTPTDATAPGAGSSRAVEWPQIGVGFVLAIALGIGSVLAVRLTGERPLTR